MALLSGCGVAANDPQTNNDNVPINNQINTPQTQTSQSGDETQNNHDQTDQTKAQQVTQTDAERANEELAQADETGTLILIDGDRFEMELTNISQGTGKTAKSLIWRSHLRKDYPLRLLARLR